MMLIVKVKMLMQDRFVRVRMPVLFARDDNNAGEHCNGADHIRPGRQFPE